MITKVLVANRGEIARRVFATCRRLGIGTVAVYTEPDAGSPHVAEADARVRLQRTNGYLDAKQLIDAARAAGADAIHPGYGFLSENAEFAAAVQDAGLTWIGPPTGAVAAMGSKIEAKKMMAAAGVPVLDELDPDTVTADQLPVLIKASAGGGGRGMRVVRELAALPTEVAAARREAQSAFGDPTVFCERYLATGHHVEVQVLADEHGTVWAVGERECSIQRRHQKIIEEAPSPLVERTPGMRAKLFDAARLAATAIGYTGAGTVEFMADEHGDFFFLEMNTRLQVEHPVTELTTGTDLVALQLFVADGGRLDAEPPPSRGYSIEARLYAEDPAKGWQPQAGTVHRFEVPTRKPNSARWSGPASGLTPASSAARRFRSSTTRCWPRSSPTPRPAVRPPGCSPTHWPAPGSTVCAPTGIYWSMCCGTRPFSTVPPTPRSSTPTAWPNWPRHSAIRRPSGCRRWPPRWPTPHRIAVPQRYSRPRPADGAIWHRASSPSSTATPPAKSTACEYRFTRGGVELPGHDAVTVVSTAPEHVVLAVDGVDRPFDVARYDDDVFVDSPLGPVQLVALPRFPDPDAAVAPARCWRPCRARCCGSVPRSAKPSPPVSRWSGWRR